MTLTLTPRRVSSSIAGSPASVPGHLDHHVRLVQSLPELARLGDRRLSVVGEIGCALERDESVAAAAGIEDGAQLVCGLADVVKRDREEQLLRVAFASVGETAQLRVVAIRAGDRLGEDRRVRRRARDRVVPDQLGELAAVQKLA